MNSQYNRNYSLVGHDNDTSGHKERPIASHTDYESSITPAVRDEASS